MTIQPGTDIGRYHILEQLGEGGMAVVYKAYDTRLENEVAIKFIRVGDIGPNALPRIQKRFQIEAKKMARMTHPNIVKVMDYGEYEGAPYLVMPFLPGGTLKELLGDPLSVDDAVHILLPIARALGYAHEQGLVHRDIKPSNILITHTGEPMISDFGVAKVLESEETLDLTGTGMGVGTPEYMAPEQGEGKAFDHRADIYALGIVLYEMLTGRKPFTADTPMAVIVKQMRDLLPNPTTLNPKLSMEAERVLFKALAKDPNDRYADMGAFAKAMQDLLRAENKHTKQNSTRIVPEKESEQKAKPHRIKRETKPFDTRWLIGTMGIFGLGLIIFAGVKFYDGMGETHPIPIQEIQITTEKSDETAHPTLVQFPTLTTTLESSSPGDMTNILSDIQLYDDFNSSDIDLDKWSPPVWNSNQQFFPLIVNDNLVFEIKEGWADWAINQPKQIKAIYALVTMDLSNTGAIGITLRNLEWGHGFYGLMLKNNSVAIWDLEEREFFKATNGKTHLLGVRMDGQKIEFFVDDKSIGTYPFDGYPNYGTLQIVSDGSITRGYFDDIWIEFLEQ